MRTLATWATAPSALARLWKCVARLPPPASRLLLPPAPLRNHDVLAEEEVEVPALLVGELQEDLLAFRVLEPAAVALEELVRHALAADADPERLPVVDALRDLVGGRGEEAVGGA